MNVVWGPTLQAAAFRVQFRRHDSADSWADLRVVERTASIVGLDANTTYDIRVAAAAAPLAGADPVFARWSTMTARTRQPRVPLWSDLVIASDGAGEIEVTRVQMLFFTVIVALFVLMRVLTSGAIPEIPNGYLVLMGISNGVYLTGKFLG
jgi:hypothetical protein